MLRLILDLESQSASYHLDVTGVRLDVVAYKFISFYMYYIIVAAFYKLNTLRALQILLFSFSVISVAC